MLSRVICYLRIFDLQAIEWQPFERHAQFPPRIAGSFSADAAGLRHRRAMPREAQTVGRLVVTTAPHHDSVRDPVALLTCALQCAASLGVHPGPVQ